MKQWWRGKPWSRAKSWLRKLRYWLLVPALLFGGGYGAVLYALHSESFSRFVLGEISERIPKIAMTDVRGTLAGGIQLSFRYADSTVDVVLKSINLRLQPSCLLQLRLCADTLSADRLNITLPKSEPSTEQDIQLPVISLPFPIALQLANIDTFTLMQGPETLLHFEDIQLSARWLGTTLTIKSLQARENYCQLSVSGQMRFSRDYPITSRAACQLNPEYAQRIGIDLIDSRLSGDLRTLQVEANNDGQWPFTISASLKPLDTVFSYQATAKTREAIHLPIDNVGNELSSATLHIAGDFTSVVVQATGNVSVDHLPSQNQIELQGNFKFADQLFTVNSLVVDGAVHTVSRGTLAMHDGIIWQGDVDWQVASLHQFNEQLQGSAEGQFTTQVTWQNEQLSAGVQIHNLSGMLNGTPLTARGQLSYGDRQLHVANLHVRQAQNQVALNGTLATDAASSLAFSLQLPHVEQLIPAMQGAINGNFNVSGLVDKPTISGEITTSDIRYQDLAIADGVWKMNWHVDQPQSSANTNQVQVNLSGVTLAERWLSDLQLGWSGSWADHQVKLTWRDRQTNAAHVSCKGSLKDAQGMPIYTTFPQRLPSWEISCGNVEFQYELSNVQHRWRNSTAISADLDSLNSTITLLPFCLRDDGAQLCTRDTIEIVRHATDQGDGDIDISNIGVEGIGLPVEWLSYWLPTNVSAVGEWQFTLAASVHNNQPQIAASIRSDNTGFTWHGANAKLTKVAFSTLKAEWQWDAVSHHVSWQLDSDKTGSSTGDINLRSTEVVGNIQLNRIALITLAPLLMPNEDDILEGWVDAQLKVSGAIDKPRVNGVLSLDNGKFATSTIPVPLDDIQLTMAIRDNLATIDGAFTAAGEKGAVDGQFDWRQDQWQGNFHLTANQLVMEPEPNMLIYVVPDVKLALKPQAITLNGDLRVPKARVEVRQLPEQAINVSRDSVVLGAESEQPQQPLQRIDSQLNIVLGDDVQFKGFGLETLVTGQLELTQQGEEIPQAKGVLKMQKGHYQAYGQNLAIRTGDLVFVNDIDNPQLRLEAVREQVADEVTVGLRATGPAQQPHIELFSVPAMAQQEQLSYLLTGKRPGTETDIDPSLIAKQTALSLALESSSGAGVTKKAGEALGIEDFKISAGTTEDGTDIGLSGYLTPNLMVRYGVGVFDAVNSLTLNYKLSKNVYLEAISGEGTALDILWSFDKN